MKWIRDLTGRFPQRPYFEQEEIDHECEQIVTEFLLDRYGRVDYPITTDDLTVLIEQHAGSVDFYADVSAEGIDVEGVTDFILDGKPHVRIAQVLWQPQRENRLRTTITHELGHVIFHDFLALLPARRSLWTKPVQKHSPRCKRETILGASKVDWLEWQAGYASGAFLMPISRVRQITREIFESANAFGPAAITSPIAIDLINRIQGAFQVSRDAARVRLMQLNLLTEQPTAPTLF